MTRDAQQNCSLFLKKRKITFIFFRGIKKARTNVSLSNRHVEMNIACVSPDNNLYSLMNMRQLQIFFN